MESEGGVANKRVQESTATKPRTRHSLRFRSKRVRHRKRNLEHSPNLSKTAKANELSQQSLLFLGPLQACLSALPPQHDPVRLHLQTHQEALLESLLGCPWGSRQRHFSWTPCLSGSNGSDGRNPLVVEHLSHLAPRASGGESCEVLREGGEPQGEVWRLLQGTQRRHMHEGR